MKFPICVTCKGKGLCGKPCPILEKIKYWKKTVENVKNFTGTSPPSIFVGAAFYPKVWIGILSPPTQEKQAEILDFPEKWYEQKASIEQILDYRGQLIYSRFKSNVKRPKGKLVETTQEVAMSKKPIDVEIELKSKPKFRFTFDPWVTPIGNPAPIINAKLTENPFVEKRVDYLISDYDIKAEEAVLELYQHKLPISRIQKIFSAGLLGLPVQRKLVPLRWSVTAVDDIIGKNLLEKIKTFEELDEIRLFHNEYIGNHYEILLIPGAYQYELIEIKHPKSVWNIFGKQAIIFSDYEPYWGRKDYAEKTGGAFYAGRIAFLEYFERIKKQAIVLIVREVLSSYWAPVGIFQMREAIRDAFTKEYERFNSIDEAIKRICERLVIGRKWIEKSKLLRILKEQKKITHFGIFIKL